MKFILIVLPIFLSSGLPQNFVETRIIPLDGVTEGFFGNNVKILGDELFISANKTFNTVFNTGIVYRYKYVGNNWQFINKISCPSNKPGVFFGYSIAVSDSFLFIGAPVDTSNGFSTGAVYLFKKLQDDWILTGKIIPTGANNAAYFGCAISSKDDVLLIGAELDYGVQPSSGAVYFYRYEMGNYIQKHRITSPNTHQSAFFGHSVEISGNYLLIGSPMLNDTGAVFIYKYNQDSIIFCEKILGSTIKMNDYFGGVISTYMNRIAISSAGNIFTPQTGSIYIYDLIGDIWTETNIIIPNDTAFYFGTSVVLKKDTLLIGALGNVGIGGRGTGYLFVYENFNWIKKIYFQASDGHNNDYFGNSCSMQSGKFIFGSPGKNIYGRNSGAVYIYNKNTVDVGEENSIIDFEYKLYQNYPNPFNPTTKVRFSIPQKSLIKLNLYDMLGTQVGQVFNGEMEAGVHEVAISSNEFSRPLSSGIYFLRLETEGYQKSIKITLAK